MLLLLHERNTGEGGVGRLVLLVVVVVVVGDVVEEKPVSLLICIKEGRW